MGDNFFAKTYRLNFKKNLKPEDSFVKTGFEFKDYCNSRYEGINENMLSRIQCATGRAINANDYLPEFMVFVLDDELIQYLDYVNQGVPELLGSWVEWLFKEVSDLVNDKIDFLPEKAKREDEPCIYWVAAPLHKNLPTTNNELRVKLNLVLHSTAKQYDRIRIIKLKENWDFHNGNLVNPINGQFTSDGLAAYWRAIDSSIEFNYNR